MTLPVRTKSARMEAERALIDAGSGPGVLELLSAADVVLARGNLADPCGSTGGTDTLTLTGPITLTAIATGTITQGRFLDSDGLYVRTGMTVGLTSDGVTHDIEMTNTVQVTQVGQTIVLATATIKHG